MLIILLSKTVVYMRKYLNNLEKSAIIGWKYDIYYPEKCGKYAKLYDRALRYTISRNISQKEGL